MTALLICAALAATACGAIAAGFENGIYALSQVRLRYRLSLGDKRARVVKELLDAPQQLLAGVLILQSVAVYAATAVVTSLLQEMGVAWAELASTLALAVLFFIVVEAVPKNVFRRAADTLVYALAPPLKLGLYALRPAEAAIGGMARIIARLGKAPSEAFDPFFTRERLAFYLRAGQTEGILSKYQIELTQNILRGEKATVSRAMLPLEKVAAIPAEATQRDFAEISHQYRFSRYPVYRGARDNIVGVINVYDCLTPETCEFKIDALLRPMASFSLEVHVTEALRAMTEKRQPMGVVVDKGRTVGIVTVKDCMEEIVGELYAW
jgi:CBS domain containing-hemolysin-like protein